MKIPEQVVLVGVWLLFWLVVTALAVGGYDLLFAHAFHAPTVDGMGGLGAYLLLLAGLLPFTIKQRQAVVKR
jgi:predicted metal-binding membrane protein